MTSTDLVVRLRHAQTLLREAADRIEELENVLRTACKADGACFSRYGACVCRGTDPAQRPPVEHHTRGSVLDYYRDIPKDKAGSSGTIAAQSPSEEHQTPASVWADWAAKLER